jgi:hypothetical protein
MKNYEQISPNEIKFLGEQDGVPERKLKTHLTGLFLSFSSVTRAYLVRISYGNPAEFNVALCIRAESEPPCDITDEINRIYADMFRTDEHLDVLFLNEKREFALSKVCTPFFKKSTKETDSEPSLHSSHF